VQSRLAHLAPWQRLRGQQLVVRAIPASQCALAVWRALACTRWAWGIWDRATSQVGRAYVSAFGWISTPAADVAAGLEALDPQARFAELVAGVHADEAGTKDQDVDAVRGAGWGRLISMGLHGVLKGPGRMPSAAAGIKAKRTCDAQYQIREFPDRSGIVVCLKVAFAMQVPMSVTPKVARCRLL